MALGDARQQLHLPELTNERECYHRPRAEDL
jgi:hypothetical protein